MKKLFAPLVLSFTLIRLTAADLTWHTGNISKPLAQAKAENKMLLLDFTGSDWCGYCKKLDAEVFETPEFAEFAKKNLILVRVDFPHHVEQSADLKRVNEGLKRRYATPFQGYPTVVILNAAGTKLGDTVGYTPGSGPQNFLAKIERFSTKK